MSKTAFIERVADANGWSKREAQDAVDAVFGAIAGGLGESKKSGDPFKIMTFGSFTITKRAARKGRNPQTGEEIKIKASKSLRFKPSAQLKAAAGC